MTDWKGAWVYQKVASSAGENIATAFFIAGVIWLLSKIWLGAAKVLFWIALIIKVLGIIHFAFTTILGIVAVFALLTGRQSLKWPLSAFYVRLVEQVLTLTALWLAAMAVGYWPL